MKIEPKHNIKRPSYAVVGAALLATTMLAGCGGPMPPETTTTVELAGDTQPPEYVELEGEATTCEDCYVDPTPTPVPTLPISNDFADFADIGSNQYMHFMNTVDEIEDAYPGEYRYSISAVKDYDYGYTNHLYYFVLAANNGSETRYYVVYKDETVLLDKEPFNYFADSSNTYSYEEIKTLPFLIDSDYLRHTETTVNGIVRDQHTPIVSGVEDGRYAGTIVGISADGTKVLLQIGKPVVLDYFTVQRLAEGEAIGYMDLVRGPVDEDSSYLRDIPVSSPSSENNTEFWVERYRDHAGLTYDAFLTSNYTLWLEDTVIVEMPVANDCKVFSRYEPDDHPGEMPDDWDINGARMQDTFFYKEYSAEDLISPDDNGWFMTYGDVDTLYITDGVVTEIEMTYNDYMPVLDV